MNGENIEFKRIYEEVYNSNASKLKEIRRNENKYLILMFLTVLIALILTFVTIEFDLNILIILLVYLFVPVIIISCIIGLIKNGAGGMGKYVGLFKEKIIAPIIKSQIPDSKYSYNLGMDKEEYIKGDWEKFNEYRSSDKLEVSLGYDTKTVGLELANVCTEYEKRTSEETTTTTLFHGIVAVMNLPENINCYIKVLKNKVRILNNDNDKFELDMTEFERIFDVETNDKIKTMQIITSDVMTKIIELYRNNVKFELSVQEDKMYIRFHTGKMLEPSRIKKQICSYEMLEKDINNLKKIIYISKEIYDIIVDVNL